MTSALTPPPERTMPQQKPGRSAQDLETPDDLIRAVKRLLNVWEFRIDLAATEETRKAPVFFGPPGYIDPVPPFFDDVPFGCIGINGLSQGWDMQGWCWLNPPFGNIRPWVEKCAHFSSRTNIALLVPAAVGSNWWRDAVEPYAAVHHLNGRPSFVGTSGPYPKDLSLCLYGPGFLPASRSWDWRRQQ